MILQDSYLDATGVEGSDEPVIRRWITIGRPAAELHRLWRQPATLPLVMGHFADIEVLSDTESRWRVEGPLGKKFDWQVRIVDEAEGQFILWRTLEGADMPNEGRLSFAAAPGNKGTELTLEVRFDPPGGALGEKLTSMFDLVPKETLGKALRRFKSLAETGEIPLLAPLPAAGDRKEKEA
ncbi:SRPBCC family protein (plasmid) [Chimaeribacter arupi]|uniref:Cyclase n=2 Tax=Yersiniaceae TaxID=1903411 RepID=A0A2N5EHF9_9GAMM|nr:SRPBCC family protein [Chimaeribacter arupi]MBS0968731.1 SRPBCC family protein [Nissabacter archeti]PLR29412.1 cyclase [Chimaeribacter arupi]PLR43224.1 cyclase [Chimaeribacter arupi]WKZ94421.1 SRPBCC family protein [Chimaeribacter arupi]